MDSVYTFEEQFNTDVQKKFLSILFYDPKWASLNGLSIIEPKYFENHILYNICKWTHEYFKQYKALPTNLILKEKTKDFINNTGLGTKEYYQYTECLDDIFNFSDSNDLEYFKEQAILFVRQASWKKTLEKGGEAFKKGNYEEILNEFKKVLSIGSENDLGMDFSDMPIEDFISTLGETYDRSRMVSTGVSGWDEALGGGFVARNLHIIGGKPGGGKSKILAAIAKHTLECLKNVVIITLELSESETMANVNSAITGLNMYEMLDPENLQEFRDKVQKFKDRYSSNLVIKFYKPGTVTCDTIHNYIQKLMISKKEKLGREWKPDLIILDYMDKLLPSTKVKGNMYEDIGGVANDCKNLAIDFDCAVVTGSQLGKYTWNIKGGEVVSMESVAESSQKAHLAHSITTINENKGERAAGKIRLFTAKSRSGKPNTVIWCDWNFGKCKLTECEPWDPKTLDDANDVFTVKETK